MKKILVTGAGKNGFLGWHVKKVFEQHDSANVTYVGREHDLTDLSETLHLVKITKPDAIVHMAAVCGGILANKNSPADFLVKNTKMNLNIYEAARMHGTPYVYTLGSICSYPKLCPVPFKEDDLFNGFPEETNAPYGLAKRHLYMMGKTYREQYGIKGVHLIPVNMMGEADHFDLKNSHVIPALINKFVNAVKQGVGAVECWGTGEATREFVYAGDVAKAITRAVLEEKDIEEPINIGTGKDISIKDLASLIGQLTEFTGEIIFTGEVSDGQPKRMLDISRAKELLNFEAEVDLESGLKKTIGWYESQERLVKYGNE